MKKTLLALTLTLGTLAAWGAYPATSYTLDGTTLEKWNGTETEIDMNSDPALAAVTDIANNAFKNNGTLKTIVIGDAVKNIGLWSFMDCHALENVTLPVGLEAIKNAAFSSCTALKAIDIPASVTTLGNSAFYNCQSLSTVGLNANVDAVNDMCFSGCIALKSLTLAPSVKTIGNEAFQGAGITSIDLSNVTVINTSAFEDCSSLATVTFSPALEEISSSAFAYSAIRGIDLSGCTGEVTVGFNAFQDCSQLATALLPAQASISSGMFTNCTALQELTIPDTWSEIPVKLANGCTSLRKLTLGSGVTAIKNTAFMGDTALKEVVWNDVLETIDWNVFYECGFEELNLPESLVSVDDYSFSALPELKKVKFGAALTSLGASCFAQCPKLQSVECAATVPPTLGSDAWTGSNTANATLYVPSESVAAYEAADQWKDFGVCTSIVTGIDEIEATGGTATIYDLQGHRVQGDNLPVGLYIIKQGNQTRKVLVK